MPSSSARWRAGAVTRGPDLTASTRCALLPFGVRLQRVDVGEQARDRLGQTHLGALAHGVQEEASLGRRHLDDRFTRLDLGDRLAFLGLAAISNEPRH